ncbi:MAG: F-box protein [Janthinobacterium lividum]
MTKSTIATQTVVEPEDNTEKKSFFCMPIEIHQQIFSQISSIDLGIFALTSKANYNIAETMVPYLPISLNLACFEKSDLSFVNGNPRSFFTNDNYKSPFINDNYRSDKIRVFFSKMLENQDNFHKNFYAVLSKDITNFCDFIIFENMNDFCEKSGFQLDSSIKKEMQKYNRNIDDREFYKKEGRYNLRDMHKSLKFRHSIFVLFSQEFPKLAKQIEDIKNCIKLHQEVYDFSTLRYAMECITFSEKGFEVTKNYGLNPKDLQRITLIFNSIDLNKNIQISRIQKVRAVSPSTKYYYKEGYKILMKRNKD